MKIYTTFMYYKDGRIEVAKNVVGNILKVKEKSLPDLNLRQAKDVLRLVAICNKTLTSESK